MISETTRLRKFNTSFSDRISPYERNEIFDHFPLWQECLNICQAQLYTKRREEDISEHLPWREHPYRSYVCFVKNHKKIQYHVVVFDIEKDFLPDQIIDLQLHPSGEYRIEVLNDSQVVVFASSRYYFGIAPIDSPSENQLIISNVRNVIGNWWYSTKSHSWKRISRAVKTMNAKAQGKTVHTVRPVADVSSSGLSSASHVNFQEKSSSDESFSDEVWKEVRKKRVKKFGESETVFFDSTPYESFEEEHTRRPVESYLSKVSTVEEEKIPEVATAANDRDSGGQPAATSEDIVIVRAPEEAKEITPSSSEESSKFFSSVPSESSEKFDRNTKYKPVYSLTS